jgi:hypothetical protein
MTGRSPRRVVYVATGERHVREAAASLASLRRHEPQLPVAMFVDQAGRPRLGNWGVSASTGKAPIEILDLPQPTYSWADKPLALARDQAPDEEVLFLDSDTRICGPIGEIFDLLEAFDLAAAHAPVRLDRRQPPSLAARVPAAFPELNTGVLAFRRTAAVVRLLDRWRRLHLDVLHSVQGGTVGDQATFRVALYESDVRFAVLPPEYNCRFTFPTYVHGPVRILHGRSPDLERIERELNAISGARVFVPGMGMLTGRRGEAASPSSQPPP